jgi:hypothetical protein
MLDKTYFVIDCELNVSMLLSVKNNFIRQFRSLKKKIVNQLLRFHLVLKEFNKKFT